MRTDLLFIGFCFLVLAGVAVGMLLYFGPVVFFAAAKLWAYGTMAGRDAYRQTRRRPPGGTDPDPLPE